MEVPMNRGQSSLVLSGLLLLLGLNKSGAQEAPQLFPVSETQRFVSFDYANVDVVIAGVAGGDRVVSWVSRSTEASWRCRGSPADPSASCHRPRMVSSFLSSSTLWERAGWRSLTQGVCPSLSPSYLPTQSSTNMHTASAQNTGSRRALFAPSALRVCSLAFQKTLCT